MNAFQSILPIGVFVIVFFLFFKFLNSAIVNYKILEKLWRIFAVALDFEERRQKSRGSVRCKISLWAFMYCITLRLGTENS